MYFTSASHSSANLLNPTSCAYMFVGYIMWEWQLCKLYCFHWEMIINSKMRRMQDILISVYITSALTWAGEKPQ